MKKNLMDCCLYFSSNRLNRAITKIAEETFSPLGLSPTYAYLLMTLKDRTEIPSKVLAEDLFLAQSTLTRLVDKLEHQGYVHRTFVGRNSMISLTKKGEDIQEQLLKHWRKLYHKYSHIIGYDEGETIVKELNRISEMLEK